MIHTNHDQTVRERVFAGITWFDSIDKTILDQIDIDEDIGFPWVDASYRRRVELGLAVPASAIYTYEMLVAEWRRQLTERWEQRHG